MSKLPKVAEILLKPAKPSKGPPLPDSFDLSWPGFFKRALDRLIKEPPWVTIPKYGLREELKREFEVVTGRKIKGQETDVAELEELVEITKEVLLW